MCEYEQAIRYPQVPRMRHRGHAASGCNDVVVDFDDRGRGVGHAGSINCGGGADGLSLPLLAPVAPACSQQRARGHQGLHISNDNTPAIVELSKIRASLMRT
jgi:hypothetical protein